jgi:hypothetical protein
VLSAIIRFEKIELTGIFFYPWHKLRLTETRIVVSVHGIGPSLLTKAHVGIQLGQQVHATREVKGMVRHVWNETFSLWVLFCLLVYIFSTPTGYKCFDWLGGAVFQPL